MMLGHYADACARARAVVIENWWLDHAGSPQAGPSRATGEGNRREARTPQAALVHDRKVKATDPATRNAGYAARAEAHIYAGLRKAGIADQ
jgi:hypothetical protein